MKKIKQSRSVHKAITWTPYTGIHKSNTTKHLMKALMENRNLTDKTKINIYRIMSLPIPLRRSATISHVDVDQEMVIVIREQESMA